MFYQTSQSPCLPALVFIDESTPEAVECFFKRSAITKNGLMYENDSSPKPTRMFLFFALYRAVTPPRQLRRFPWGRRLVWLLSSYLKNPLPVGSAGALTHCLMELSVLPALESCAFGDQWWQNCALEIFGLESRPTVSGCGDPTARRYSGSGGGEQGGQTRKRACELGLLARAVRENLFWTTSSLEPNFSGGVTFDAKIFCSVWLGVLE